MCEGVCNKCREKLQWRFKYNKYKPLKTPSSCRDCNNKAIHKAYRALCDPCATKRKVCSGCSKDIVAANLDYIAHHKAVEEEGAVTHTGSLKGGVSVTSPDEYVVSILGNSNDSSSGSIAMDEESSNKRSKSDHPSGEQSMQTEDVKGEKSEEVEVEKSSNLAAAWDERKFNTIANLKYSKERVVGSTEDGNGGASTVFSFNK